MAKAPDPLKRRHLIERGLDAPKALALAEAYLAEGRTQESLVFLKQAEARERLEAIREEAAAAGDVFLLRESSLALGEETPAALWRATAEAAQAAGKGKYAEEAARQAARLES